MANAGTTVVDTTGEEIYSPKHDKFNADGTDRRARAVRVKADAGNAGDVDVRVIGMHKDTEFYTLSPGEHIDFITGADSSLGPIFAKAATTGTESVSHTIFAV